MNNCRFRCSSNDAELDCRKEGSFFEPPLTLNTQHHGLETTKELSLRIMIRNTFNDAVLENEDRIISMGMAALGKNETYGSLSMNRNLRDNRTIQRPRRKSASRRLFASAAKHLSETYLECLGEGPVLCVIQKRDNVSSVFSTSNAI